MMTCPHCENPSIGAWQKYCASRTDPVVCRVCGRPSYIPAFAESVSTVLYAIVVLVALNVFAFKVMAYRSSGEVSGPTPGLIIVTCLAFFVVVEAAKVYWVPLQALSDTYVAKQKAKSNKWMVTGATISGLVEWQELTESGEAPGYRQRVGGASPLR